MSQGKVAIRAHISKSFQSEVENGHKTEVSGPYLLRWAQALNVTEAFMRGEIKRYHSDPVACRGLALDVRDYVKAHLFAPEWLDMSTLERPRRVLSLIARTSKRLPRVVLAWVLNLDLIVLDQMINGKILIPKEQITALAGLTDLSEPYLMGDPLADEVLLQGYGESLRIALGKGVAPDVLKRLLEDW